MANSEIIGAGQDTARRAPKKEENGCVGCYFYAEAYKTETDRGCMSSGPCVYEPERD